MMETLESGNSNVCLPLFETCTIYGGEATQVVAPAWNGSLGILRGHAPLMALLGTGTLRIENGADARRYQVAGGFLQVVDNTVTVLSEHATAE